MLDDNRKFWIICVLIVVLGCVIALTCYVAITTTTNNNAIVSNNTTLDNTTNITNITDNGDGTVTIKTSDGSTKKVSKSSPEAIELAKMSGYYDEENDVFWGGQSPGLSAQEAYDLGKAKEYDINYNTPHYGGSEESQEDSGNSQEPQV